MRTLLVIIVIAVAAPVLAGPSRVAVLSDREPMSAALRVALANRSAVTSLPSPEGGLRLDRAAAAQRTAMAVDAQAGVWIEDATGELEVCVVSADGMYLRHAPLRDPSPRVFAAIATSLLDELLVRPEPAPAINVSVAVAADHQTIAPASPRASRTLLEVGPLVSTATFGVEAELAFPVTSSWRFGIVGSVNQLFDGIGDMMAKTRFYAGGVEIRYVGDGRNHFDVGVRGGLGHGTAYGEGDTGELASMQLTYAWETALSGVEVSLAPTLLAGFRGHDYIPGAMASLRWQLPL